jgi:hypothetical protein
MNRMEKRAEYEAYEATQRKKQEDDADEVDEEEDDDEEEDEDEAADASDEEASDGEASDGEASEDEEEAPPPKKKKKPAKEPKPRSRSRTAKVPRLKVVWGVFNNSYQAVATYDYPKRKDAEEHAARLRAEKKQTFFVQPIKEPIEEKKEA